MSEFHWYLDEIRDRDKDAFLEHFRALEIYENTSNIPYPYSEEDALRWIKIKKREKEENGAPVSFAIRRKDGFLIGGAGFDGLRIGKTHAAELGYWLAKSYWNKGIMSAAVKEVCDIGFFEYELIRIEARVFKNNRASERVLEKCGFEKEGCLRKAIERDGEYKDANIYGLIRG